MAVKGVGAVLCYTRNVRQDLSRYHGGVKSGRAERGSYCMQAQLAAAAIGCKLSLPGNSKAPAAVAYMPPQVRQ